MQKIFDLITDPRNIWFSPFRKKIHGIRIPKKIVISFDIEENYPDKTLDGVNKFLLEIQNILKSKNIPGTFFVQGSILSKVYKALDIQRSEIGLHGFNHNNWGKEVWFWDGSPLEKSQKQRDLEKSLNLFKKLKLSRPTSFRAPNMNISSETLQLLAKNGFEIDSSLDSFRRLGNKSFKNEGIQEIPVSSDDSFKVFNLQNCLKMNPESLKKYISKFDSLVFLAHPWEFYENPKFSYCSPKNYSWFVSFLDFLKNETQAEFITLNKLVDKSVYDLPEWSEIKSPVHLGDDDNYPNFVLHLENSYEQTFQNLYHSKTRNIVRKARKESLKNKILVPLASDVSDFYNLYVPTMKKLGALALSKRIFDEVFEKFKKITYFSIAKDGDKVVSILWLFKFSTKLYVWANGSNQESLKKGSNYMVYDSAIQFGSSESLEDVVMGNSEADSPQAFFKKRWGAVQIDGTGGKSKSFLAKILKVPLQIMPMFIYKKICQYAS